VSRWRPGAKGFLSFYTVPHAGARPGIPAQDRGGVAPRATLALIAIKRQRAKK
jgi:hypothetical protein